MSTQLGEHKQTDTKGKGHNRKGQNGRNGKGHNRKGQNGRNGKTEKGEMRKGGNGTERANRDVTVFDAAGVQIQDLYTRKGDPMYCDTLALVFFFLFSTVIHLKM